MQTRNSINQAISDVLSTFAPPPKLTVSQWADEHRILSPEASAEQGQWMTERAEYQREIMDAISDPLIETIVLMSSAQIGKTEILNNICGYFIDQDPSPILIVQSTLTMAQSWSKDRLAPMLRDTPALQGKVKNPRSRDSNNTTLHKVFPGGHITICGANSPSGLAARPIRIVLGDEIDRFPISAGTEGDPVSLAFKRTTTFWNRKRALFSTPTVKGASRIEAAWEESDKRYYNVPCMKCGEFQVLKWAQVKWEKDSDDNHLPSTAKYQCEHCGTLLTDADKLRMVRAGSWMASEEFTGIAGFHIWEAYSPWVKFSDIVKNFLEAKKHTETLQAWVNTSLGETWEEDSEGVDQSSLYNRREQYVNEVPADALVLTAGIDVQHDRIEMSVYGWGEWYVGYHIDHKVMYGDPSRPEVWTQLGNALQETYSHQYGHDMKIIHSCIDTGFHTNHVYNFVKNCGLRVFAVKGSSVPASPLINRGTNRNAAGVTVFTLGTDTAKDALFAKLRSGQIHFPMSADEEFFSQLTSESVVTKYRFGFAYRQYVKDSGRANEALDCLVYSYCAVNLLRPNWTALQRQIIPAGEVPEQVPIAENDKPIQIAKQLRPLRRQPQGGWVNGWKT